MVLSVFTTTLSFFAQSAITQCRTSFLILNVFLFTGMHQVYAQYANIISMTEAGELQTQTIPTEAPAPKPGLFRKMIELFTRKEKGNEKRSQKYTRERLLEYVKHPRQEPKGTFEAGSQGAVDLTKFDPGTVFRVKGTSQNTYTDNEFGENGEKVAVNKRFDDYFWFIKGLEDDVFQIAAMFHGKFIKGPIPQEFLSNENPSLLYVLVRTKPTSNLFKPEDALKTLIPDQTVKSTNQEKLDGAATEFDYLCDAYVAKKLDVMQAGRSTKIGCSGPAHQSRTGSFSNLTLKLDP